MSPHGVVGIVEDSRWYRNSVSRTVGLAAGGEYRRVSRLGTADKAPAATVVDGDIRDAGTGNIIVKGYGVIAVKGYIGETG